MGMRFRFKRSEETLPIPFFESKSLYTHCYLEREITRSYLIRIRRKKGKYELVFARYLSANRCLLLGVELTTHGFRYVSIAAWGQLLSSGVVRYMDAYLKNAQCN